jgi:ferric-dicitrate binding protein FerR (iron transport regulator)
MTSWITGEITQEEALRLKQLIAEDPAIKSEWMEFRQKFSKEDIQDAFDRYDQLNWIPAGEITGQAPVPEGKPVYRLLKRISIAAIVIISAGLGWYFANRNPSQQDTQPLAVTNSQAGNEKDISLQLASGQTINLSTSKDSIVLGDARLNNAGKALSYKLSGAATEGEETAAMNRLRVPIGKDYKVALSDGTEIWLNSATTLQFPFKFSGKTREISIHGEAYLKVARQAGQPFLVHTQHGTVQVLGTSFNINDYDPGVVKVALVEGAVRFKTGKKDVAIRPGQQAVYRVDKDIRLQPFEEEEVLAWRSGKYYFSDATLQEIVTVLPRWYGINVVIDNPELGKQRFAGLMDRNKPVTTFLDNLSRTMKISYYFDKDILHLQ